jgi:acetyltransferase-like isoleucine patch superfamily enzyme
MINRFLFRWFGFMERKLVQLRTFYWSRLFATCGARLRVYGKIIVYFPQNIHVGHRVYLSEGAILHGRGGITLGNHVHISSRAILNTQTLDYRVQDWPPIRKPIVIHDFAWVASGALIIPGITIGEGAIVGMGAVVTHDVPPYTVVGGNPARKITDVPAKIICTCKER